MTWTDMFREEVVRLHAHEEDVVPTLQRIRTQAHGAHTHEVLLALIDAAPARLARLDVVMSFAGWEVAERVPMALVGWKADVDDLMDHHPRSVVLDATILALVLKVTRLRTAGYEAAHILATSLDADHLAALLLPLWTEDLASDDRAAGVLAALVASGGRDWESAFRLSQGE